jgi:hypothetical protein
MKDEEVEEGALAKLRSASQMEPSSEQFFGVFKMPQVIKSYEANESNNQYHDQI